MSLHDSRPAWWDEALCAGQGPGRWTLERGQPIEPLRSVCARCPVAGDCLRDAMTLTQLERVAGPVRCGVSSGKKWGEIAKLVAAAGDDPDYDDLARRVLMMTTTTLDPDVAAARRCGLSPAVLRRLRALVATRSEAAFAIGDLLVEHLGPPPPQGRNDASGEHMHALADTLAVSASWLIRLRTTAHAWPVDERRSGVAWNLHKHIAGRADRGAVLEQFVAECRGAGHVPSLERYMAWEDAHAPRAIGAVRRRLTDYDRAERAALRLPPTELRALVERLALALVEQAA